MRNCTFNNYNQGNFLVQSINLYKEYIPNISRNQLHLQIFYLVKSKGIFWHGLKAFALVNILETKYQSEVDPPKHIGNLEFNFFCHHFLIFLHFFYIFAESICTHYSNLSGRPDIFLGSGTFKKSGTLLFAKSRVQKNRVIVIQKEKRPGCLFSF